MARAGRSERRGAMGFNAAWSMAVGGMIGGGIFSVLGVVVDVAGPFAAISFVLGGLVALATGYSYAELSASGDKAGGLYRFLDERGHGGAARIAAWVLILGYTLTVSVYGFTFGAYVGEALGTSGWVSAAIGGGAILTLTAVNLLGAGEASEVEIVTVWGKLFVLVALAAWGLWRWQPQSLATHGGGGAHWTGALIGAGTIFMAYEGFQLLAYDYAEMEDRQQLIRRVIPAAILATIAVYVAVSLGAAMLVGADTIVADKETALATAGRAAWGPVGFVVVTVAAGFSASSAINATLFATARLARDVARDGRLPALFGRTNGRGSPYAAVLLIGAVALVLALLGGLHDLVSGASLVFMVAFATVNLLAWRQPVRRRWIPLLGLIGALVGAATLTARMAGFI